MRARLCVCVCVYVVTQVCVEEGAAREVHEVKGEDTNFHAHVDACEYVRVCVCVCVCVWGGGGMRFHVWRREEPERNMRSNAKTHTLPRSRTICSLPVGVDQDEDEMMPAHSP